MIHPQWQLAVMETSTILFEGLAQVLGKHGPGLKIQRISDLNDFFTLRTRFQFQLGILNPTLIQGNTKTFNQLKSQLPEIKWIAMVSTLTPPDIISMFDQSFTIADSSEYIIGQINHFLSDTSRTNREQASEPLSEREIEVLKLLAIGLPSKEIADKLSISTHTVITHRKNITQKTSIKSISGLTIYAVLNKYIQLDSFRNT